MQFIVSPLDGVTYQFKLNYLKQNRQNVAHERTCDRVRVHLNVIY